MTIWNSFFAIRSSFLTNAALFSSFFKKPFELGNVYRKFSSISRGIFMKSVQLCKKNIYWIEIHLKGSFCKKSLKFMMKTSRLQKETTVSNFWRCFPILNWSLWQQIVHLLQISSVFLQLLVMEEFRACQLVKFHGWNLVEAWNEKLKQMQMVVGIKVNACCFDLIERQQKFINGERCCS